MAETTNSGSGDAATNTTTVTTGRGLDSGVNTPSSSVTADASAKDTTENAPAALDSVSLPYPHQALNNLKSEGTVYKDLIAEVYKEHERELKKEDFNSYKPSDEMIAARADSQVRLAAELRASLAAQRSMMPNREQQKGTIKIKLSHDHTHGGVSYSSGDEIFVDETSAKFIEDAKVGKRV